MQEVEHGKFKIHFDEKKEMWYTHVDTQNEGKERIENASLQKLKKLIDNLDRKKFERIPVFVYADRCGYRSCEKKYEPMYEEATITSISPAGKIFYVRKGKKNAEQAGYWSSDLLLDTPANRKLINEIEEQGQIRHAAEHAIEAAKKKLKQIDRNKLFTKVYSRDLK